MQAETIKASEFKAKCLQLMDEVNQSGKEIIITKNGKPVSKLVPFKTKPITLFGAHQHQVVITGDIIAPLEIEWEAAQ